MDAVSEVLIARAPKARRPELDARRVGDRAHRARRGVRVRAGVVVRRGAQGAGNDRDADQPRRPGRSERRRAGDARRPHRFSRSCRSKPKKPIEPVRPPAAKTPEMIEPTKAPPKKTTPNKVEAKDPRSTQPTKGDEDSEGLQRRRDRREGPGASACRRAAAAPAAPRRLELLLPRIPRDDDRPRSRRTGTPSRAPTARRSCEFVIQTDGRIADITVEQSSGVAGAGFLRAAAR